MVGVVNVHGFSGHSVLVIPKWNTHKCKVFVVKMKHTTKKNDCSLSDSIFAVLRIFSFSTHQENKLINIVLET